MSMGAHKSRDDDLALTVHDIIGIISAIAQTLGHRLDSIPLYKNVRLRENLPPRIHGYYSAVF